MLGSRGRRRVGWALASLALLVVLAWQVLPRWARGAAERELSAQLGRAVHIGELRFKPWSLETEVLALRVDAAAADAPPTFSFDRLYLNAAWSSLWHRAPVLQGVELQHPVLRVARTAPGQYDIDDLIARLTAPSTAPPREQPLSFALHNLQLIDGEVHVDDRPVGARHDLVGLQIGLPLLSNLPSDIETHVQPRVAFRLNDAAFDSDGQVRPFRADRAGELSLHWQDLDLADYAGYVPQSLPWRVPRGRSTGELEAEFSWATGQPALSVKGQLALDAVEITTAEGAPLLAWDHLAIPLDAVQPFERRIALGAIDWQRPRVVLRRLADGRLEAQHWAADLAPASAPPAPSAASASAASAALAAPVTAAAPASPWTATVAGLRLADGAVRYEDAALTPARHWAWSPVALELGALRWPAPPVTPLKLSAVLAENGVAAGGEPASGPTGATFALHGEASDREARLQLELAGWPIAAAAPYLAAWVTPAVQGTVGARLGLAWTAPGAPVAAAAPSAAAAAPEPAPAASGPIPAPSVAPSASASASSPPAASPAAAAAGAASPAGVQRLTLELLTVDDFRLTPPGERDALAWQQLRVESGTVDLLTQRATLGRVRWQAPSATVIRYRDGRWAALEWWRAGLDTAAAPAPASDRAGVRAPAAAASAAPELAGASASAPWQVQLDDLKLDGGALRWADASPVDRVPVDLEVRGVELGLQNLHWSARPVAGGPAGDGPAQLQLSARIGLPSGGRVDVPGSLSSSAPGSVRWTGQVAVAPLRLAGQLKVDRFPVHVVEPYFGALLPVQLVRARAGYGGRVEVAEARGAGAGGAGRPDGAGTDWQVRLAGDALLGDVAVYGRPDDGLSRPGALAPGAAGTEELLSFERLRLPGVKLALQPGAKPSLALGLAELSNLYARLVVTEQGRLNLQDIRRHRAAGGADDVAVPGLPASAASAAAPGTAASAGAASAASVAEGPASAAVPATPLPVDLDFGGLRLVNARIDFSDRFIRPNYSAALTELNGGIGAFRSGATEMAAIDLRGRAAGTALLEIVGRLNPTAQPLALELRAKASDLELAPLSPYAGKYAGYAIERGKLSMDVNYRIQPDGRLEAGNQVTLNQLTFGERIESPEATKLPVLLAVALLKDRNGVIDIDLPISGSINDPQFSIGRLIWKVLGNLLVKAVTSPFSLLSGGGGPDLSQVAFVPGRARLTPAGQAALDKVARALTDRPALKMTVTGRADPATEVEAYRAARLEQRLLDERRREREREGAPADAAVELDAAARERLTTALYEQTPLPDKPRNALGLAKSLPVDEMAARLRAAIPADGEALRELALQRGLAVRDALVAQGLPAERLFLAAPKLLEAGRPPGVAPAAAAASAAATLGDAGLPIEPVSTAPVVGPSAELSLSVQ